MKNIILTIIILCIFGCGVDVTDPQAGYFDKSIDNSVNIDNSIHYSESIKDTVIIKDTVEKKIVDTIIDTLKQIKIDTVIKHKVDTLRQIKVDTVKSVKIDTVRVVKVDTVKQTIIDTVYEKITDTLLIIDTIKQNIVNEIIEETFYDERDGKIYKLEQINGKTWFKENLNFKANESYCYDNKESNCDEFGRLYTYKAALNACPTGFHLPNKVEIEDYADYYDITKDKYLGGAKNNNDKFFDLNRNVYLRTNEYIKANLSCYFQASFNGKQKVVCGEYGNNSDAFSVRCIKD